MTKTLTEKQTRKIIENVTGKAAKVCEQKFYGKPKSLTEQWQEGELKEGHYYTLLDTDSKMIEINYCWDDGCFQDYCDNMIEEVLAPVPSYEEYQQLVSKTDKLEKQLEIATEALKKYQEAINHFKKDPMNNTIMPAHQLIYDIDIDSKQALTKMEGVK